MKSITQIINELKEIEEDLLRCMKCGFCQSVCPLYIKDGIEPSVARGKLFLIHEIKEGKLKKLKSALERIDYCLLCRRCAENCPSGVKTDIIFLKARHTLRKIEALPWFQRQALALFLKRQNLIVLLSPFINKIIQSQGFRRKISRPFIESERGWHKAPNEKKRVILYPGCAVNLFFPHWAKNTVELLIKNNISVWVPPENICCGIPAATMGDLETYKELSGKNWYIFGEIKADAVITLCPTCQYALTHMTKEILLINPFVPVLDILQFLNTEGIQLQMPLDKNASYHIPCHYPDPDFMITFLKKTFNGNWYEPEERVCCGFGGTFSAKFKEASQEIGSMRMSYIKNDTDYLFTCCPGCALQLEKLMNRKQFQTKILHPVEIISHV